MSENPAYNLSQPTPQRWGWTKLRGIGNSYAARLTIAIPLAAYLILLNENLLRFLELSRELFGQHVKTDAASALVSWRLLTLYFGLCLVAIGSAIYAVFCPQEIKSYTSVDAYKAGVEPNLGEIEGNRIESALQSGDEITRAAYKTWKDGWDKRRKPETQTDYYAQRPDVHRDILTMHFDALNRSHPWLRGLSWLFFATGIAALAVPSSEVFYKVTLALIDRIVTLLSPVLLQLLERPA